MNKIDFKAGSKLVSFRNKSLFIDDNEFLYNKITNIRHSASKHIFAFEYDGKVYHFEQYDPRLEKTIIELFSRISLLSKSAGSKSSEAKAVKAHAEAKAPVPQEPEPQYNESEASEDTADEESVFSIPTREFSEGEQLSNESESPEPVSDAEPVTEIADTLDVPESAGTQEPVPEDDTASAEDDKSSNAITASDKKNKKNKKDKKDKKQKKDKKDKSEDSKEKGKKLKKSFIVFAIIIVVIGLLTLGYFKFFGTSDTPTSGPNTTNGQDYDNIDQLVDDME